MIIIYRNIYRQKSRILLTSGFHAETLMTILKVETSRQKKYVACAYKVEQY